jgi:hypothetical protein
MKTLADQLIDKQNRFTGKRYPGDPFRQGVMNQSQYALSPLVEYNVDALDIDERNKDYN